MDRGALLLLRFCFWSAVAKPVPMYSPHEPRGGPQRPDLNEAKPGKQGGSRDPPTKYEAGLCKLISPPAGPSSSPSGPEPAVRGRGASFGLRAGLGEADWTRPGEAGGGAGRAVAAHRPPSAVLRVRLHGPAAPRRPTWTN